MMTNDDSYYVMERFTYLDWMNNWLTTEAMASHYGVTECAMSQQIERGRIAHEAYVASLKGQVAWYIMESGDGLAITEKL